jgi:phosphate transport system protein
MRKAFEAQLSELVQDVARMGDMVTLAVKRSIKALKERDIGEAERIKHDDIYINDKRWEIEEACVNLIATQQPVASDLRELIAVLNVITDLERMGDYAEGIAKIVIKLGDQPPVKPLIDIPRMAELAVDMIDKSLKAFANRDEKSAREISKTDDDVDQLYHQLIRELITIMIEDPKTITRSTYLIWIAHRLERIADRVTNINERTIFLVTGEIIENPSSDTGAPQH